MRIKNCEICGREFEAKKATQKYCGAICKAEGQRRTYERNLVDKTCECCGKPFRGKIAQKYCGNDCKNKSRGHTCFCENCGEDFKSFSPKTMYCDKPECQKAYEEHKLAKARENSRKHYAENLEKKRLKREEEKRHKAMRKKPKITLSDITKRSNKARMSYGEYMSQPVQKAADSALNESYAAFKKKVMCV